MKAIFLFDIKSYFKRWVTTLISLTTLFFITLFASQLLFKEADARLSFCFLARRQAGQRRCRQVFLLVYNELSMWAAFDRQLFYRAHNG